MRDARSEAPIGRERELGRMLELLDGATTLAIVVVQGEAGVGKSHLLRALVAAARARGLAAGLGRFFDEALEEGFAAWHEALGEVDGRAPERAPSRAAAVAQEVARLRAACEAGPVLLVFDDLHWADPDTLFLLRQLARRPPRVRGLLVLARRTPEVARDGVAELLAEAVRSEAPIAALQGLDLEATQALLDATAARAVSPSLTAALHAETRGNPLFLREAMRHVMEREAAAGAPWSGADAGVPPGVQAIVAPRVARLGPARGVVELLAARPDGALVPTLARATGDEAGRPDAADRVRGAASRANAAGSEAAGGTRRGSDEPEGGSREGRVETALAALSTARDAGLVEVVATGDGARARFVHELVRRAVWDALTPVAQAEVHRRWAETLVATAGTQAAVAAGPGVSAAEIAAHFHGAAGLAGAERGVPHALAAARQAARSGAVEAQVGFARLAATLAEAADPASRAEAAVEVARAEVTALDLAHAPASAWRALELLAASGASPEDQAAFIAEIARELKLSGVPATVWRALVERGRGLVGAGSGLVADRLALLVDRLEVLATGRAHVAAWLGGEAEVVARLRAGGDEHDLALTVDTHEARAREETAVLAARARTFAEPLAALRVLDAAARDVFFRDGDMAAAVALAEEVEERALRVGSVRYEVAAGVVITCATACMGRLDVARSTFERAADAGLRLGQRHRLHAIGPLASRLVIAYIEGAERPAWEAIADDLEAIVQSPTTLEGPFGHVALQLAVMASGLAGRSEACAELMVIALDAGERSAKPYTETGALRDCVAIGLWTSGGPEALVRRAAASTWRVRGADRASFSSPALSAARLETLLARADGRLTEAAEALAARFAAARAELTLASQHALVPVARLDEAELWQAIEPARARAALAEAIEGFERFGMPGWAAKARRLEATLDAGAARPPGGLTPREAELLGLLAQGLANKEIASRLFISVPTVERHVANIYDKIGCRGRAAATAWALKHGLGSPTM